MDRAAEILHVHGAARSTHSNKTLFSFIFAISHSMPQKWKDLYDGSTLLSSSMLEIVTCDYSIQYTVL